MKPKPFKINGNHDVDSCVFKLFYGKTKYVVIKAKSQILTLQSIENILAAYFRGNAPNPTGIYYHLLLYVKKNPSKVFSVHKILYNYSENKRNDYAYNNDGENLPVYSGYELLKAEQLALDEGKKDKNCLNNNTESYIPLYNPDKMMYGWLTSGDVLNFNNWLPTRKKRKSAV